MLRFQSFSTTRSPIFTFFYSEASPTQGFAMQAYIGAFRKVYPDPRDDPKSRSLKGVPRKYPFVVRVPN